MSHTPLSAESSNQQQKPTNLPLVLLAWGTLAYTWVSAWLQPGLSKPLPIISAWLQPALHVKQHTWCLFKGFTQLPCFFCGLTRSFVLIGKGEWQASLQYHLLGIPIYLFTLGIAIFGLVAPHKTHQLFRFLCQRKTLIVIGLVLTVCWLWKLGHDPRFW